jgi:hypothetical protein
MSSYSIISPFTMSVLLSESLSRARWKGFWGFYFFGIRDGGGWWGLENGEIRRWSWGKARIREEDKAKFVGKRAGI